MAFRFLASETVDDTSERHYFLNVPDSLQDISALQSIASFSLQDLAVSLTVYCSVAAVNVLWFCWYRTTRDGFRFLTPKRFVWPDDIDPVASSSLLRQPTSMFTWVCKLLTWQEADILRGAGYDALVFLRVLDLCFKILVIYSFYGFGVVLPVNWYGGLAEDLMLNQTQEIYRLNIEDDEVQDRILSTYSDESWSWGTLTKLTILNIRPSDQQSLLAHFVGVVLVNGLVLWMLTAESRKFVELRRKYLSQPHRHRKAIIVEEIPPDLRTYNDLRFYFSALYPDKIDRIILMHQVNALDKKIAEREKLRDQLEHCMIRRARTRPDPSKDNRHAKLSRQKEGLEAKIAKKTLEIETERARLTKYTLIDYTAAHSKGSSEKVAGRFGLRSDAEVARFENRQRSTTLDDRQRRRSVASRPHILATLAPTEDPDVLDTVNPMMDSARTFSRGSVPRAAAPSITSVAEDEFGDLADIEMTGTSHEGLARRSNGFGADFAASKIANLAQESTDSSVPRKVRARSAHRMSVTGALNVFERQLDFVQGSSSPKKGAKAAVQNRDADGIFSSKAIIIFNEFTSATIAPQVLHSSESGSMAVSEAPDKRDIFWPNMIVTRAQKAPRKFLVDVLLLLLTLLFIIPATALALVVSEDAFVKYFPSLESEIESGTMLGALVGYVHPSLLLGIMNLLPPVMTGLGLFEGCLTWSACSMRQLDRFLWFLVVNVVMVTPMAGAVSDTIFFLSTRPPIVLFLLMGSSLPCMASFFIQYLVIKACLGLSMELNRGLAGAQMILRWVLRLSDATRRDREKILAGIRRWNNPGWMPFGKVYANILLIMCISLIYATIAPLVLIGGIMWFGFARLVYMHSIFFVYEVRYETGGNFFPKFFRRLLQMMLIAQFVQIGVFFLKDGYTYGYLTGVISIGTLYYTFYVGRVYANLNQLPLELSIHLDLRNKDRAAESDEQLEEDARQFTQPAMYDQEMPAMRDEPLKKTLFFQSSYWLAICKHLWSCNFFQHHEEKPAELDLSWEYGATGQEVTASQKDEVKRRQVVWAKSPSAYDRPGELVLDQVAEVRSSVNDMGRGDLHAGADDKSFVHNAARPSSRGGLGPSSTKATNVNAANDMEGRMTGRHLAALNEIVLSDAGSGGRVDTL